MKLIISKIIIPSVIVVLIIKFTTVNITASCRCDFSIEKMVQNSTAKTDGVNQDDKIIEEDIYLELNKEYSVRSFRFTIKSLKIRKNDDTYGVFFSGPSNPDKNPSYDGVLRIELTFSDGDINALSKLKEIYLLDENGEKNVEKDIRMMLVVGLPYPIVVFNVPASARKMKLGISSLELNLEKILNESNE